MDRELVFKLLRERILGWATSSRWARLAEPEDLAQEVLLELSRRYPEVESLEDLVPLSFRILDNKRRNAVRKTKRRKEDLQTPIDELLLENPGANPEERMISSEGLRRLAAAAGRLRPRYRQLLRHQLRGKSLKEVSELLGAPEGTIYSRWSRCKEALEKELRKLREQEP